MAKQNFYDEMKARATDSIVDGEQEAKIVASVVLCGDVFLSFARISRVTGRPVTAIIRAYLEDHVMDLKNFADALEKVAPPAKLKRPLAKTAARYQKKPKMVDLEAFVARKKGKNK